MIKWVPYHDSIARSLVADDGDRHQIWRVGVSTLESSRGQPTGGGLLVWIMRKGLMTARSNKLTRQEMLHRDFDLDRSFGKLE
jgi:hypothetical protein